MGLVGALGIIYFQCQAGCDFWVDGFVGGICDTIGNYKNTLCFWHACKGHMMRKAGTLNRFAAVSFSGMGLFAVAVQDATMIYLTYFPHL